MPAQKGFGLDAKRDERWFPLGKAAGQEQAESAIAAGEVRPFDWALHAKRDKWSTEHGVFEEELALGAGEVGKGIG